MFTRRRKDCNEITAPDGCRLQELLQPSNTDIDLPYSLAFASLAFGQATRPHRLAQTEVYYIVAGTGVVHIDDEESVLGANDLALVPSGAVQWVENSGSEALEFIVIVSPPWRADDDVPVAGETSA